MAWKYIMFENKIGDVTIMFPVIFPDKLVHSAVYDHLKSTMPGWHSGGVAPVSAGKIEHITVLGLGGDSETLGVESLGEEDASIIRMYSYEHGIIEGKKNG